MSAVNKREIVLLMKQIEKKEGKGSIYTIGGDDKLYIPRWSTGIDEFDNIVGGGIPKGRVLELSGAEGAGKTTLAYYLLAQHGLSMFIDAEGTFDGGRAKVFGNKKGRLFIRRPECGEEVIDLLLKFGKAGMPIIVVDSIPSMVPRELDEGADPNKYGRIGAVSGLLSRWLPSVHKRIEKSGTTIVLLNQLRDKFGGVIAFGDNTDTPGGRCLKHTCSLRIKVGRRGWIEGKRGKRIGQLIKLRVIKSKVSSPQGECEIPFLFDRGFVTHAELKDIRKELKLSE